MARGDEFALFAGERGVVDHERHRQRRLVDRNEGERVGLVDVADRLADVEVLDAAQCDYIADRAPVRLDAAQPLELIELDDLFVRDRTVGVAQRRQLTAAYRAADDLAYAYPADVVVVVDVADDRLQTVGVVALGCGDLGDDRVEQRAHIFADRARFERRPAQLCAGVDDLEVDLIVVRAQLQKQLEHFVDDLFVIAAAVDLVDDDHGLFVEPERLFEHIAGLRHAPLDRVDEQQYAVDHGQNALHLAAEIGVPRSVDDVDLDAVVVHGGVFGENGDAAFAFERVAVHDPVGDRLAFAEDAVLFEQLVDQGRLAVVDVCYDRDVANVLSCHL